MHEPLWDRAPRILGVGLERDISNRILGIRDYHEYCANDRHPKFSLFKYLRSQDVRFYLEKETVRLGTLQEYAVQDGKGGVGDPNELVYSSADLDLFRGDTLREQRAVENLRFLGIADLRRGGWRNFKFSNMAYRRANRFIQCFAREFSQADLERWGEIEGYDACIEIADAVEYARLIQKADPLGSGILWKVSGANTYQGGSAIDDVRYAAFPLSLGDVDFSTYSFYKDSESFSWQKEIRVSWPLTLPEDTKPYFVQVPGIAKLVQRIA